MSLQRRASLFAGCFSILLGLTVLIGWQFQISLFKQLFASFIPMYCDTAVVFTLCGTGLIFLVFQQKQLCRVISITVLFLAALNLIQYMFDINIGLDGIFIKFYDLINAPYPGRMAPNTAINFLLSALSLLLLTFDREKLYLLSECFCQVVIALSVIAIIGYLEGLESAYTIGEYIGMALYTAIGFLVFNIGIWANINSQSRIQFSSIPLWMPIFWSILVLQIDLYFPETLFTGILHTPLLFCSMCFRYQFTSFVLAFFISLFIILGYYLSPSSDLNFQHALFNRSLLIAVVWVMAYLIYQYKNTFFKLLAIQTNLENMVSERVKQLCEEIQIRKETEQELKANKDRFRFIFENAASGIALMTIEGKWVMVNQRFCDIVGYTQEELKQKTFHDITHPDDLVMDIQYTEQLLRKDIQTFTMEKRYIRKDQTFVWVNLTASIIYDDKEKTIYTIKIVEDITKRKELESQLVQAQKMESIGQLAGGIAHDFNNLLVAIKMNTEFAMQNIEKDSITHDDLQEVLHASDKASALTRQLLAFSRKQVMELKIINVNQLILNVEKMLRRLIGEHIELRSNLDPELGNVNVDPGQFEQIVINLIVNARDAMPDGGTITIETKNAELDEYYSSTHLDVTPGSYIMLVVSDNGCGMEPHIQEKIFDPFFTTKGKDKGTGLGLSTVFGIVKQFGGSIHLYSELDKGSVFRIYLPRVEGETETSITSMMISSEIVDGCILVVEDNDSVRQVVVRVLQNHGYQVLEAKNGAEALANCSGAQEKIDLLLTDMIMPEMSGRELAEKMKEKMGNLKVLFMSGYTDNVIVHHGGLEKGAEFLQKPFNGPDLLNKVNLILTK